MKHYIGLDVSVRSTSLCIVDGDGRIVQERKLPTESAAIAAHLASTGLYIERLGLEAGVMSQHLYSGLAEAELPVVCVETRHMKAALSAQLNKTDRHDARGIAQMIRVGLYKPVHVKSMRSQRLRMVLTARQLMRSKLLDVENELRGLLRNFGLDVGKVTGRDFEPRVRELASGEPALLLVVEPLLAVRDVLRRQFGVLDDLLVRLARDDAVCRRLMTVPGVGPLTALTFRATVDTPARFVRSRTVGAHFGLTPRKHQSGETDRMGRISKWGDAMMRTALYEAAQVLLTRVKRWTSLKAWAIRWRADVGGRRRSSRSLAAWLQ
jgi:transposase